MTDWAWCGAYATDGSDVHRIDSRVSAALWYGQTSSRDRVWTLAAGGAELLTLADACPALRWSGRVGAGSLLSLRAPKHAEVRDVHALLPWLEVPELPDADRCVWLLGALRAELESLRQRGYAVDGRGGPRLTVGALAWATAASLCPAGRTLDWGDYDAGRRAYFGGRCEVFRTQAVEVQGWDIARAYPWALMMPVPVGRRRALDGAAAKRALDRGVPGAYRCTVDQPADGYARLPWRPMPPGGRGRSRGPILWVTGRVEGTWTVPELWEAQRTGAEVTVERADVWEAEDVVWAPYVEHTGADRAAASKGSTEEESAKLLANALTGKLGQSPDVSSIRVVADGEEPELGWHWHGGRVWSKRSRHVPTSARTIQAAVLTSRPRAALAAELYEARECRVYCDTDSLWRLPLAWAPSSAPWRLDVPRGLLWQAWAPKVYRYVEPTGRVVTKAAGTPASVAETMTALARGRSPNPRRYPPIPREATQWCGMRRINEDQTTTTPLHRTRDGELVRQEEAA